VYGQGFSDYSRPRFGWQSCVVEGEKNQAVAVNRRKNRQIRHPRLGHRSTASEANAFYAGEGHLVSAWAMGLSVPALVFLMGRIAQLCRERRAIRVSNAAGIVGMVLLFLSVHHCSTSIQSMTGAPWYLALASAISIDCGLVVSELAAMVRPPKQPKAATTGLRLKK
jgi:hypothetical protein